MKYPTKTVFFLLLNYILRKFYRLQTGNNQKSFTEQPIKNKKIKLHLTTTNPNAAL